MKKGKILIIGANSFLGRAIIKYSQEEFDISAVYHQHKENVPEGIELLQVREIDKLKGREFNYVFLVSSYVPSVGNKTDDQRLIEANIQLPLTVCNLFPSARIIFSSSVSVYEKSTWNNVISVSLTVPAPQSLYAISKLWGEQIIAAHASYAILRISSMYGIGMKPTTFIPKIIESARVTGTINLLGKGDRFQNYIHVEDVAQLALRSAKSKDNLLVHAVSEQSYSNKEIAEKIAAILPCQITYSGSDNTPSYYYDNHQTTAVLGAFNYKNIDEGLKEFTEWSKKGF